MKLRNLLQFLSKGSFGRRYFLGTVVFLFASGVINGMLLSKIVPTVSLMIGVLIGVAFLVGIILRLRDIPLSSWWSLIYIFAQIMLAVSIEGTLSTPIADTPLENPYPLLVGIADVLLYGFIGFLLIKKGKRQVH